MRAGDGVAALETGDTRVIGGPCGETLRKRYAGTETGESQVYG